MNGLVKNAALGFSISTAISGGVTKLALSGKEAPKSISKWIWDHYPEKRLLFIGWGGRHDGSTEAWQAAWKKYLSAYSGEGRNPFNVNLTNETNAPQAFMSECKKRFSVKVSSIEDERLVHVLEYCTRSTSVEDLIMTTSKSLVSSSDSSAWSELWNIYKKDNENKGSRKDEWGLLPPQGSADNSDALKNKCDSEKKVKTGSKTNRSFINVLKYCSK
ncbi:hypothetical protein MHC_01630 [Mycoplasma haemocanis str. Illinois]|uniref:Uncharacterized protein n=1 Tax=Mycoplasma haemocanis (strain Illinois) TaxID=1111676 RepID=H6N6C0_MYCHN|nr:hypothetical protein [Mycoplasma haemocanis]AEW45192.1 hypothetical protein MHC_01630 [Mycoplasma haemocanis str. Illinois]